MHEQFLVCVCPAPVLIVLLSRVRACEPVAVTPRVYCLALCAAAVAFRVVESVCTLARYVAVAPLPPARPATLQCHAVERRALLLL